MFFEIKNFFLFLKKVLLNESITAEEEKTLIKLDIILGIITAILLVILFFS